MPEPEELLQRIRQKLLVGELPKGPCRMTWYGVGQGGICQACDQPITKDDVEVECDLHSGGTLRFHRRCHEEWAKAWPTCDVLG